MNSYDEPEHVSELELPTCDDQTSPHAVETDMLNNPVLIDHDELSIDLIETPTDGIEDDGIDIEAIGSEADSSGIHHRQVSQHRYDTWCMC